MTNKSFFFFFFFLLALSCLVSTDAAFSLLKAPRRPDPRFAATTVGGDANVEPPLIRYRARVAYDGSYFFGFQLQNSRHDNEKQRKNQERFANHSPEQTIQAVLEEALNRRFGRRKNTSHGQNHWIRVVAAGRTDAGVHARGQAIHFDLSSQDQESLMIASKNSTSTIQYDPLETLAYSINRMLPPQVQIWNIGVAPLPKPIVASSSSSTRLIEKPWNVMYNNTGKWYSYRFSMGSVMDPVDRHTRWHLDDNSLPPNLRSPQGIQELREILLEYVGTHDFVCFTSSLEQTQRRLGENVVLSTVRTIHRIDLIQEGDEGDSSYYRIDFYLNGALYKMIRNLVGTAMDVWKGTVSRDHFSRMIHAPREHEMTRYDNKSKPAPPEGLCMEYVYFSDSQHDDDEQSLPEWDPALNEW